MVQKNDFSDRDDFMEKCQDTINYVRFLWCIGNEEIDKYNDKVDEAFARYLEEKENEENEDNK